MKYILPLLLLAVLTHRAVGQEHQNDSLYSGLMIVPFPPTMYLSDSDREIAEASEMNYDAIRGRFRLGLDISFAVRLQEQYGDHSLLRDTSDRAEGDLQQLYRNTRYSYAFTPAHLRALEEAEEEEKKKIKNPFKKKKEKPETPEIEQGLFGSEEQRAMPVADEEGTYMKVTFRDSTELQELADAYGIEVFLFLNQFEIDTRFDDCIDFQNKIYNREIRVHYDLIRADGKRLDGGVLTTTFPSSVNDVNQITRGYFGGLTDGFVSKVPARTATD